MVNLMIIVEGYTEQDFVNRILAPHLGSYGVWAVAPLIGRSGHKGGDVRFDRLKADAQKFLSQQADTYITLFFDFYGIGSWPGLEKARGAKTPAQKSKLLCESTHDEIRNLFSNLRTVERFIPYFSMHEFEALLFSAPKTLAQELNVALHDIESILDTCGEPENINDSKLTAPSKRLEQLRSGYQCKKRDNNIRIAQAIGLATMRRHCPLFDAWVRRLENLAVLEIEVPNPKSTAPQQKD